MAAGSAVSRGTGFVRTSVWAAALGLNVVGSTFLIANTIPTVVFVLLAGGALNSVLIPTFVRAADLPDPRGRDQTDKVVSAVLLGLLAVTVLATAAAPAVARLYAGSNWTASDVALTTAFAYWCLPQIFFYGLYSMLGQLLNSRGRYGAMMWSPVLNNVIATAVGMLFLTVTALDTTTRDSATAGVSSWQVAFLGGGATAGVAAQALALLRPLHRSGFRFRFRFDLHGAGLRRVARAASWTSLFVLAGQAAYLVTTVTANTAAKSAGVAGMPAYSNAYLIWLLPHGIVTVAVTTATLPRLTRALANGHPAEADAGLAAALRTVGAISVVAAAALVVGGEALTRVAFPGNDPAEAHQIAAVLTALAPALPAFSLQYLLLRGFYARDDTRTPALLQLGIGATNIAAALLAGALCSPSQVAIGLAAGYGLSCAGGFLLSAGVYRRRYGDPGFRALGRHLGRYAAIVAPATAIAIGVRATALDRLGDRPAGALAAGLLAGTVFAAVAAGSGWFLLPELRGRFDRNTVAPRP